MLKFFFQRTHSCNIQPELIGMNVTLCGWLAAEPDGKCFVLQDGYGLVPVIYNRQVLYYLYIYMYDLSIYIIIIVQQLKAIYNKLGSSNLFEYLSFCFST